jgi:ABC-type methionine transport system ATPase subunit
MTDATSTTHLRVRLTFPPGPATDPVIYEVVTRFDVVPNIRRAKIENHVGWMVLDIAGEQDALDRAVAYLEARGVDVSSAEGDVVEG